MEIGKECLALMLGLALLVPRVVIAQPTIAAGRLGAAAIDVTKPNASPVITLDITGAAQSIAIQFQSPSGFQGFEEFYSGTGAVNGFTGRVVLQGYGAVSEGSGTVLSLYSEPGAWKLTGMNICTAGQSSCSIYSGSSLQALFPRLTFSVVNPNTPDVTPPTASSAVIRTPVISLAKDPTFLAYVFASDDLSGIDQIQVYATSKDFTNSFSFGMVQSPVRPVTKGRFSITGQISTGTPPGDYTITALYFLDNAGNSGYITDAATITKIFNNKVVTTITN
jgi:hypothetical protein